MTEMLRPMLESCRADTRHFTCIPAYERAFKNKNGRIDGNLAVNTPYALHSGRIVLLFV